MSFVCVTTPPPPLGVRKTYKGVGRQRLGVEKDKEKKGASLSSRSQDLGWQRLPVTICGLEGITPAVPYEAHLREGCTHLKEYGLFVLSTQEIQGVTPGTFWFLDPSPRCGCGSPEVSC